MNNGLFQSFKKIRRGVVCSLFCSEIYVLYNLIRRVFERLIEGLYDLAGEVGYVVWSVFGRYGWPR